MVLSLLESNLQRLFYEDIAKKVINICHESDVYVTTGVLLRVIVQASKAVDKYFEKCKTLVRVL
jgi:phosphosulfolactate synthase (CoM biosynthesis protein A)